MKANLLPGAKLSRMIRRGTNSGVRMFIRCLIQSQGHPLSSFSGNEKPQDSIVVLQVLSSYSNDWTKALEFFSWVESRPSAFTHCTETYNKMIDILGKYFEFDLVWSLVQKMSETSLLSAPNHDTFRAIFKRYVSAHLVNEAISAYNDRVEEFNLKDDKSFCNLIDALCEYKHVSEAQDLVFSQKKMLPIKVYNMILRGWLKVGWWTKCKEFWKEMDVRGIQKDLHSYSIYMDICCKSGKPWRAVKVYKEMKKKGMGLDVVAYNTVIQAVGQSQGADFAIRMLTEMKEAGCEPNVVSYNCVIGLLCNSGRVRDGYRIVGEMRKRGINHNVMTYHCFLACVERPRELFSLFESMMKSGMEPRIDTFVMVMKKFGRWGFLRPVLLAWRNMEELGLCPDACAYNALIDALIDKGMLDLAKKFEQEMLDKGLSARPRKELRSELIE